MVSGSVLSCGEKYLKVDYYDIVGPETMLVSQTSIEQGLNSIYDMLIPYNGSGRTDIQQNWNIKPHLAFGNYPALDCQASGWDNEFARHEWRADKDMFFWGWMNSYQLIDRANRFLSNLELADPALFTNSGDKNIIEAEARALRAFQYSWLAQNFGALPMLRPGDTYSSSPGKARESTEVTWNLIIEDFTYAMGILDWQPWKGQKGRVTVGMIKAYLAQAYMYNGRFADAKEELKDIIDSGLYALNPVYGNLHIEGSYWDSEAVWEMAFPNFASLNWGTEGTHDAVWFPLMLTASPEYGGWGALNISYEYAASFEPGDKRRNYSVVGRGEAHPFTGELIGSTEGFTGPTVSSENVPNNYGLKYWKRRASGNPYNAQPARWMRYAAVLLNYAECCFETGDATTGWEMIRQIRNRAWGNLEVGAVSGNWSSAVVRTKVKGAYVNCDLDGNVLPEGQSVTVNIPYSTATATVPDAQAFYTTYKADKGYTADVWKVALTIERRHEFLSEYSFWYDLCRTEMAGQFLDAEYPIGKTETNRQFSFNTDRMLYPIPVDEITKNPALTQADQNPGY